MEQIAVVGAAPGIRDTPALPAALSFRDALRTIPQESLVTRETWGRLCPCSIRGVTAKRVSWGWFFQRKASLLSVKWKISPAPPLLVLGVLGSVGALHLSSMNGIPRPYFPSLLQLSPSLRDPPGPGLSVALLILAAAKCFLPIPSFALEPQAAFPGCLAGVFLPGGTIWWDASLLQAQIP